jgi:hypothetical protein
MSYVEQPHPKRARVHTHTHTQSDMLRFLHSNIRVFEDVPISPTTWLPGRMSVEISFSIWYVEYVCGCLSSLFSAEYKLAQLHNSVEGLHVFAPLPPTAR